MKIRFKKGDPREGMVAEFNSSRGRELVQSGAADEVNERDEHRAEIEAPEVKPAKKSTKKGD